MKYFKRFDDVPTMVSQVEGSMIPVIGMANDSDGVPTVRTEWQHDDEIWYTSTNGNVVTPYAVAFGDGVTVVSNTYANGKGVMKLSGTVTTIGYRAFYNKTSLKSIIIPNTVTSIGEQALYNAYYLTYFNLHSGLTSIGAGAFYSVSLSSLSIPSTLLTIDDNNPFRDNKISSITVDPNNPMYDSRDNCNAIIQTSINKLVTGCKNTVIPNTVTNIGNYSFFGCDITTITIPDSVTRIGEYSFRNCKELTSIHIPVNATTILSSAFMYCNKLAYITVDPNNQKYDSRDNCNAIIETATNELIISSKNTVIPNTVTKININAFYAHDGLASINIPASVTSIGAGSLFGACGNLSTITVDPSNPVYDSRDNCNAIIHTATNKIIAGCKGTIIPSTVTTIEGSAFYNVSGLTSIVIPNSVTSIGTQAFRYCGTAITCEASTPPTLGSNVFSDMNSKPIYVPAASVEAYKAAEGWSAYASRIQVITE